MQTSLFDYHLPEHLIARNPAARRDRSRLMVVNRATGEVTHTEFAALPEFLPHAARLFRNNATVLRARLRAQRPSGGQVECLLLRPAKVTDLEKFATADTGAADNAASASGRNSSTDNTAASAGASGSVRCDAATAANTAICANQSAANAATKEQEPALSQISPWDFICLLKPGKRLRPGETFSKEGHFTATVLDKHPDGENRVRFTPLRGQQSVVEIATLAGDLPLPPYIEQARLADAKAQTAGDDHSIHASATLQEGNVTGATTHADNERYQTVYADPTRTVAAAAPTAGLHFTPELLARLAAQGTTAHDLTLHVGLDTFRPITAETIQEHQIHRELYEIPPATLAALEPDPRHPRVAVGTTTLRSIEHYFRHRPETIANAASGHATPPPTWIAEADIFIYPPAQFSGVEALITNFHLPKSTLLCLVSAFLTPGSTDGIARLKHLYAEAIARNYRFFSYGDAMLIL